MINIKSLNKLYYKERYFKQSNCVKEYVKKRRKFLNKGNIVLDFCCGQGLFLSELKKKSNFVVGIDISIDQIKRIKKERNLFLIVADGEQLPFKKESFDFILCNAALHHFENVNLGISEVSRVCNPKGRITLIEPNRVNILIFLLGLKKRVERNSLKLNKKKIVSQLNDFKVSSSRIWSLVYPSMNFNSGFIKLLLTAELIFEKLFNYFGTHLVVKGVKK